MPEIEKDLYQTVVNIICESLFLDPKDVKMGSRLVDELGMNSLDFLDIMFSLETALDIRIQSDEVDAFLRPKKSKQDLAPAPKTLAPEELALLIPFVPDLGKASQQGPVKRNEVVMYFTVETVLRIVQHQLREKQNEAN